MSDMYRCDCCKSAIDGNPIGKVTISLAESEGESKTLDVCPKCYERIEYEIRLSRNVRIVDEYITRAKILCTARKAIPDNDIANLENNQSKLYWLFYDAMRFVKDIANIEVGESDGDNQIEDGENHKG